MARFFVGLTRGWYSGDEVPSPEAILAHFVDVASTDGFSILPDAMSELQLLLSLVRLG